jgi:hypothetical protein
MLSSPMKANSNTKSTGNGNEKATDMQKQYLLGLSQKNGLDISESEMDSIMREEASQRINELLGEG